MMASALERDGSSGGSSAVPATNGGGASGDGINEQDYPAAPLHPTRSYSPSAAGRPPTSAEIDAVIAAAMANAPPIMPEPSFDRTLHSEEALTLATRSITPLMTNLLPAAVGADGRVNLFIGNLPYRVRWQDLKDLFRKAGTVLRADVSLGPDNRSRGYGTVLMGSREDAARAIDRFNGYMWQTRTLEVRPDRLPPEYEAQPHSTQPVRNAMGGVRPPMYTYHNMSGGMHAPVSLPGHLPPTNGPSWLPGQMFPSRPPNGGFGPPGQSFGSSPMNIPGSSPIPPSHSPNPVFGVLPGQMPQLGASPLAGSLSTGMPASMAALAHRRDSLTPFRSISPEPTSSSIARSISPAPGPLHHRGSLQPPRSTSPAFPNFEVDAVHNRAPSSNSLAPIPPSVFAPPVPTTSPTDSNSAAHLPMRTLSGDDPAHHNRQGSAAAGPIVLEGLSHQGMGLGPVDNLHDRVVFVSNLPLTMQWQDLKDLLRPAGLIIRADIATDDNRKPRGFGTALFGTEADAARAVQMFNGRDINGQSIRVYLERNRHMDALHRQNAGSPLDESVTGGSDFSGGTLDAATGLPGQMSTSPIGARLPWSLNTSMHSTPSRPPPISTNAELSPIHNPHSHTPAFRSHPHPGPISMPPFAPLDGNPLSPLQTRGLPPMTPSMPGFVFNAHPETPPVPHPFLSPGIPGPFSPGIPITSPSGFSTYNPFLNPAPGAPVNRFPGAGSAQLATPTTQSFPNAISGSGIGPPGGAVPNGSANQEYFPTVPGNGGLDTPSRMPIRPNASPLNARDRLASSSEVPTLSSNVDELANQAGEISLNDQESTPPANGALWARDNGGDQETPPSPSSHAQRTTAQAVGESDYRAAEERDKDKRKEREKEHKIMMRQSLDEHRPSFSLAAEQAERRASFGDLGL